MEYSSWSKKPGFKCAHMNFFKELWRRYKTRYVRYAPLDYGLYFEQSIVHGMGLESCYLGKLVMPGGFVLACDPLLGLHNAQPYTRRVPPGQYPVTMLVAGNNGGKRNALLKMNFSEERALHWELALLPGQALSAARSKNTWYGFTADAGIGCLCDGQVQKHFFHYLERFFREQPEGDVYTSLFAEALSRNGGLAAAFYLPSSPASNVILFHTGYGDGIYPAYWGLAENGNVCSMVIDFLVL